jgi:hypothetical protein
MTIKEIPPERLKPMTDEQREDADEFIAHELEKAKPPLADAPCSARQALELCAMWTKNDIDRNTDPHGRSVLRHRMECIEQGLADLDGLKAKLLVMRIKNLEPNDKAQPPGPQKPTQ